MSSYMTTMEDAKKGDREFSHIVPQIYLYNYICKLPNIRTDKIHKSTSFKLCFVYQMCARAPHRIHIKNETKYRKKKKEKQTFGCYNFKIYMRKKKINKKGTYGIYMIICFADEVIQYYMTNNHARPLYLEKMIHYLKIWHVPNCCLYYVDRITED